MESDTGDESPGPPPPPTDQVDDLMEDTVLAQDLIPLPQGEPDLSGKQGQLSTLMTLSMRGSRDIANVAMAAAKVVQLRASVETHEYAIYANSQVLDRNDRQELKEKIQGACSMSKAEVILASAPEDATPHLLDFIELHDAADMAENELQALPDSDAKSAIKAILDACRQPDTVD